MEEYKYRHQLKVNNWNLEQSSPFIKDSYPDIEKICIKLDFIYLGIDKVEKSQSLTFKPYQRDYFRIDCINPECVNSDLDLSNEIRTMISQKEKKINGKKICNGYQDYERFRAKNHHCLTTMTFEIEVEYK